VPPTPSTPSTPSTVVLEVGALHLIRVRAAKTGPLPTPEQEFDCATVGDEYGGRLRYLGFMRCD
jgi:hypothetical protein